ncbi:pyruvate carboxylase [Vicingus serpentipes]|uniref:Pyruvate carboxylase n=1 Tax=Vicingus serpentipes TaxID=1926625 RepID=A0A5C6RX08_9FLAO|nr:pyruvate carboxylase [Vicingus serpentipes]TXB66898.1 pyruvate carboxylase [Vicingus serpentipes]
MELKKINKLLVANRGEIAIRIFRAATELHIRTVAIYTYEDRYSLHRYKADESYQIGKNDDPLKPYLDIEEIINVAKNIGANAIHPGYGFLSENVHFAKRCREEGIIFVGPAPEVMEQLGDKIAAKLIAVKAQVPVIEGSEIKTSDNATVLSEAHKIGYPIMIKAAAGGGGRGMRVVRNDEQLLKSYYEAKGEAGTAFGDDTIFIEKFIDSPKHIEVQIMADEHGNMVHLFERDCSVQRRFQKVVEVAPCQNLSQEAKNKIYNYATSICKSVNYNNVGTVEFLVDPDENIYFIEVNPRIQVEHTITEEITGIDIVRSQIQIARGYKLADPQIFLKSQEDVKCNGYAIQCRITTEDPQNNFTPDYGTIVAQRTAAGYGIRLDAGSLYTGSTISPFFDSMLVKISASGRTLKGTCQRLERALKEFRIRGVKTNIGFLENVITHPDFQNGDVTVKFIENHPELFEFKRKFDRGTKTLKYLGEVIVNGNPDVKFVDPNKTFVTPIVPDFDRFSTHPKGTKDLLTELGRDKFIDWVKENPSIKYTDTTFRDAHQSLLATRVRTTDMLKVAEGFSKHFPQLFSMEMWGGATFDVSMRFLHEDPWARLQLLRKAMPNVLTQMLIRSSNAVGYTAYPDNLVEKFIEESGKNGLDVFRIFDSLNWFDSMKTSITAVNERTDGIAEACICYTGDILDPTQHKYTLQYYLDFAKQLEDAGAHILGIKDMAGLLKPYSAHKLITELKKTIDIPIHLHTHDTSGLQVATYLQAVEAGVDIMDVALSSVSGLTSQPNFNSLVAMFQGHPRAEEFDLKKLNEYSNYWEAVREQYYPFESGLKAGTAQVFDHEIPGGQYSNLRPQARGLGLEEKFETIKKNYETVNDMFGDIVKVTPSSKVVGDMAMFMTSNNLTEQDVYDKAETLSFPESVINFFKGDLGQPYQGFPEKLQKVILKNVKPYTDRPNAHLAPIDFEKEFAEFQVKFNKHCNFLDFLSYKFYPKVFEDYFNHHQQYGDVSYIPTTAFFYGLKHNEEITIEFESGKMIIVEYLYTTNADDDGYRNVFFNLNGQTRGVKVKDNTAVSTKVKHVKAEADNEIGAPLQGKLVQLKVKAGDVVKKEQSLFVLEAMKMESTVTAPTDGKVKKVHLTEGTMVEQSDLVVEFE